MDDNQQGGAPRIHDLPTQTRDVAVVPGTANDQDRQVEVVWSAGAAVPRRDGWSGKRYMEELSLDPVHVDLSRLNNGAPVLDTHFRYSLEGVIGVVVKAWIEGGEGRAILQFSERDGVAEVWADVQAGVIRNVSVGYSVSKYEVTEEEGKLPVYRAVDWQPYEVSMVPVGADDDAGTRGVSDGAARVHQCEFITRAPARNLETEVMTDKTKAQSGGAPANAAAGQEDRAAAPQGAAVVGAPDPATPSGPVADGARAAVPATAPATAPAPSVPPAAVDADQIRAETRANDAAIRTAVRGMGFDEAMADDYIAKNVGVDEVRRQLIDQNAERHAAQEVVPARAVDPSAHDEVRFRREHMQDAMMHRFQPDQFQLSDGGRQYRGMSLVDMGRHVLERSGVNVSGMVPAEIAAMALNVHTDGTRAGGLHGTSDFPIILANTASAVLRQAYGDTPQSWRAFCRRNTARDFKNMDRVQFDGAGKLLKVNEGGEIKRGTVSESKETYALATYAKIFAVTRQTLINDDLGAFTRMPMLYGRAAAETESDAVVGIITGNPAMSDGTALFHADHGNLAGTGAAIGVSTVGSGRTRMRMQTGLDGETVLNLAPRFLYAPVALETVALQFNATNLVPTKVADGNPYKGTYEVITEARLDADSTTAWYQIADPAQIDTIEYSYLEGQEGVRMETRQGFDVEGVEMKAVLDFAAAPIDHRGFDKNAGA